MIQATTRRAAALLSAASLALAVAALPLPSVAEGDPVLAFAGDIASCSTTGDEATAALLDGVTGTVATTGDNVYPDGTATEFTNCYEPSWGRHKGRTRPSTGNHDYHTVGAGDYFSYFGSAAGDPGKGYYSYDVGTWHIVSLNSNCAAVGGCAAGSPQEQWLRADLAANSKDCTLAYWHHPLFSSGPHGNHKFMQAIWQALYDAGADVVVNGHDHDYERFEPQTSTGGLDTEHGIREFVAGMGGRSHDSFVSVQANSAVRDASAFGVLKLTLHTTSYDWQFVPQAGQTFTDTGSTNCATGSPPPPPPPPTTANLLKNPSFETDANGDTRPDNWTSSTKFSRSTVIPAHQGTYVGRHQASDPSTTKYTIGQTVAGIVAGGVYAFTGWVNIPATADAFTFSVTVTWQDAGNALIKTDTVKTYTGATQSGWDGAQASFTAPTGATKAQVRMTAKGLAATIYVDDFALLKTG